MEVSNDTKFGQQVKPGKLKLVAAFPARIKQKDWFCNESCEMPNVQHNVALNQQLNLDKSELLQIQRSGLQVCQHVLQIYNQRL